MGYNSMKLMKFRTASIGISMAAMMAASMPAASAAPISAVGCAVGPSRHLHSTVTVTAVQDRAVRRNVHVSMTAFYEQEVWGPNIMWRPKSVTLFGPRNRVITTRYLSRSHPTTNISFTTTGGWFYASTSWIGTRRLEGKDHHVSCATPAARY